MEGGVAKDNKPIKWAYTPSSVKIVTRWRHVCFQLLSTTACDFNASSKSSVEVCQINAALGQ